jgi:hypothetical protein
LKCRVKPQATHAREGTVDAVVALLGRQLLRDRVPRLRLATEVRELRMLSLEGSTPGTNVDAAASHGACARAASAVRRMRWKCARGCPASPIGAWKS